MHSTHRDHTIKLRKGNDLVVLVIAVFLGINCTLLLLLAFMMFFHKNTDKSIHSDRSVETNNEIAFLRGKTYSLKEYSNYFTTLAKEKGAVYAYNVLTVAPIAPNIDLHLLGHFASDMIYREKGIEGMAYCTEDFRNACSHSIVIGAFIEQGDATLASVAGICKKAPGGNNAYGMCFHGFGHGVLAAKDYDLEKAITACRNIKTEPNSHLEYSECAGGAVMEIIGGGFFHNKMVWEIASKKYTRKDDPLYPCSGSIVPDDIKQICYVYLTPRLFEFAGKKGIDNNEASFQKAFTYCNKIPITQPGNRQACYGGFGKEFAVFAKHNDIRKSYRMTNDELQKIYDWCLLADNEEGKKHCIVYGMQSLYWGGDYYKEAPIEFCELIPKQKHKDLCFQEFIALVNATKKDTQYKTDVCNQIPSSYEKTCKARLDIAI